MWFIEALVSIMLPIAIAMLGLLLLLEYGAHGMALLAARILRSAGESGERVCYRAARGLENFAHWSMMRQQRNYHRLIERLVK